MQHLEITYGSSTVVMVPQSSITCLLFWFKYISMVHLENLEFLFFINDSFLFHIYGSTISTDGLS